MKKKYNVIILFTMISILSIYPLLPYDSTAYANIKNTKGREVIIAIIDTGIDYTHDELKDKMWINTSEIPEDGIDNDKNGFIDDVNGWNFYSNNNIVYNKDNTYDDHGTHCAGIIAGLIPNTPIKLMSIKILGGSNRSGSIESLLRAIHYAEKMGADICNISLGTWYNNPDLETEMKKSQMLFVVAAGNEKLGNNNDDKPIYPASYSFDNIISVANLNQDGTTIHDTSNYGVTSVDLAAPGVEIYSTLTHNNHGYMSGTSMAAPFVTGTVAMVYSLFPSITLIQAKEAVLNTATVLPSLTDKVQTGGILDSEAAIAYYSPTQLNLISSKTLKVGKTYTLKPSLTPIYAQSILTYTSSNKKVVTVSKTTGKIKAIKKGNATITVKTSNGLIATCLIYIK